MTRNQEIATRGPVCIVDDDVGVCDSLSVLLETHGFAVLTYASGAEFLKDDRRRTAKCLVIDQHMPGLDGLDVVGKLQRDGVSLPAILITGRLDAGIAQRAGARRSRRHGKAVCGRPARRPGPQLPPRLKTLGFVRCTEWR
jgi:two-component system, LuxR family, response regulator FixJ